MTQSLLEQILRNAPREVLEKATVIALKKTMTWLRFQAAKEISQDLSVRLPLIRQRFRSAIRRGVRTEGEVAVIVDDIPAIILGVAKTPHGVRTGAYEWEQGFVADWHKFRHPRRVWQRLGRERLPIAQAKIPMRATAEDVMESYATRAQRKFLADLEYEITRAYRRWA